MKQKFAKLALCCVSFICLAAVTACGSGTVTGTYPPDAEKLSGLIGRTKAEVFEEYNISDDDVVFEHREYRLSAKKEYLGYSFDLYLQTDTSDENEELYGFAYRIGFIGQNKQAAECVRAVMDNLKALYGDPDDKHLGGDQKLTEDVTRKDLDENPPVGGAEWIVSDKLTVWAVAQSRTGDDGGDICSLEIQYRYPNM